MCKGNEENGRKEHPRSHLFSQALRFLRSAKLRDIRFMQCQSSCQFLLVQCGPRRFGKSMRDRSKIDCVNAKTKRQSVERVFSFHVARFKDLKLEIGRLQEDFRTIGLLWSVADQSPQVSQRSLDQTSLHGRFSFAKPLGSPNTNHFGYRGCPLQKKNTCT